MPRTEPHPRCSRGMLVLAQDAAGPVESADVKVDALVAFVDRFWQRVQGCGACEGAVGLGILTPAG
ncbi:MAG: hypothetical protein QOI36_6385 [Pseudonocardiales bacterium]|nr:hypothetical protein [Pseudonocardiales bacterium]